MQYDQFKMGHGRLHCFLGFALALAVALPSAAEPATEQVKVARKRFQEGVAAADARNYEAARLAFQQAYALKPHPSVLRNLGQAELKTGHHLDAARHLSTFIRDHLRHTGGRESAKKSLAEAETKIGKLLLEVDVAGAEITVDGEISGRSPLGADPIYVEPGQRVVRVQKDGYDLYEQTQGFEPDRVIRLKVALRPTAPAPTEAAAVMRVPPPTVLEPVVVPAPPERPRAAPARSRRARWNGNAHRRHRERRGAHRAGRRIRRGFSISGESLEEELPTRVHRADVGETACARSPATALARSSPTPSTAATAPTRSRKVRSSRPACSVPLRSRRFLVATADKVAPYASIGPGAMAPSWELWVSTEQHGERWEATCGEGGHGWR